MIRTGQGWSGHVVGGGHAGDGDGAARPTSIPGNVYLVLIFGMNSFLPDLTLQADLCTFKIQIAY